MQSAKNNWEGRCSAARPPHKKVREGMRDANPLPLGRSLDLPTRSRPLRAAALPVNAAHINLPI